MDSATPRVPTKEREAVGCGSSAARTSLCHSTVPRKLVEPARGGQGQMPGPAVGCVCLFTVWCCQAAENLLFTKETGAELLPASLGSLWGLQSLGGATVPLVPPK